jgi:hypothetical protein
MTEELGAYKNEVEETMAASLEWQRDLVFTATTQRGYDLDFDADIQMGCMPVEGLLMSLAGCMAIDVVAILKKMRCEIESFRMEIKGAEEPDSTPAPSQCQADVAHQGQRRDRREGHKSGEPLAGDVLLCSTLPQGRYRG